MFFSEFRRQRTGRNSNALNVAFSKVAFSRALLFSPPDSSKLSNGADRESSSLGITNIAFVLIGIPITGVRLDSLPLNKLNHPQRLILEFFSRGNS